MQKRVGILGSTGSIGKQALEVIQSNPDKFRITILTAQNNASLLVEQALAFSPDYVVIANEKYYYQVKSALQYTSTKVLAGKEAVSEVVKETDADIILTALVGYAGLQPTISAINSGKQIALANKETLVVAGELITHLAQKHQATIYPVDSEHSAIFQCLVGENYRSIEKIILTASGGPFRGKKTHELMHVTKQQALKHPNWQMGAKITIDSATLMNKGLEVIEAKWLFGVEAHQIEVVVHPQSIIHSIVQFEDGSMKAQMGLPDMKLPIQYALSYPHRLASSFPRFDFTNYPSLTFEKPDTETFRNLDLAFYALQKGGNFPCILNAANEVAVARFLKDEITFLQIAELNEICMERMEYISNPTYDDYVMTHHRTSAFAQEFKFKKTFGYA
ncbi:MAG: 1-deoxy-D-xylulose-5-phosphate reductoisomerase [Cytophagales bacterium]|nr:1-deoxy-D-xylulose-5-phosphate reductoisomerase [Cytophagales bacterium]MDW8385181.1 1-deoxy-D-xylulose-5-phosphate reductoisomerase [Flammeovirgaceae bacterium]